jgi:hypothetical protein
MPRTQVTPVTNADAFNPPKRDVFTPVDMLNTAPAPPPTAEFYQLANALKEVQPEIAGFMDKEHKAYTEQEIEAGKTAAITNALGWKDAVEKGTVPANSSPWFMRAYKEQNGRLTAEAIHQKALTDYQNWDGKDSDDPQAFQKFSAQSYGSALKTIDDPDVLAGAAPQIEKLQHSLAAEHAVYTSNRVYNKTLENTGIEIGNALDRAVAEGKMSGQGINMLQLGAEISAIEQRQKFVGVSRKDINGILIKSVGTAAELHEDPSLLKVLDLNRPDGTPGAGRTLAGREEVQKITQTIYSRQIQKINFDYEQRERARKAVAQEGMAEGLRIIAQGGRLDEAFFSKYDKADPNIRKDMVGFSEQLKTADERENVGLVAQRLAPLYDGSLPTREQKIALIRREASPGGSIRDPKTAERLLNEVTMIDKTGILDDSGVRNAMTQLDHAIDGDPMNPKKYADQTIALRLKNQARQEMLHFGDANPKATPTEKAEFADRVVQRLHKQAQFSLLGGGDTPTTPAAAPAAEKAGKPAAPAAAARPAPPQTHIDYLKANRDNAEVIADFTEKYGSKAVKEALGSGK